MFQLYCPACENVVWVEETEPDVVVPCPACEEPLFWLARRKARPVTEIDPRLVAAPALPALPAATVVEVEESEVSEENWDVPEEQDFSLPVPEASPIFLGLPYRAEGGVSLARLPLFAVGVWLAGIGLGLLAGFLGQICYLILIYPLVLGLALAGVTVLFGHMGRVRSPLTAGLIAAVGGMLAVSAMHLFDYQHVMHVVATEPYLLSEAMVQQLREVPSFVAYLEVTVLQGLTISGQGSGGLNLGPAGTLAYLCLELMLVMLIAALGGSSGARDPFCSGCQVWKQDRFLGTLHDSDEMRHTLKNGRLHELQCYRPSDWKAGELVLTVSLCPRCGSECPVDVRLDRNPRSRQEPNPAQLPLRITLPGAAVPVLEHVFQPTR